jgi:hypothetical protein
MNNEMRNALVELSAVARELDELWPSYEPALGYTLHSGVATPDLAPVTPEVLHKRAALRERSNLATNALLAAMH